MAFTDNRDLLEKIHSPQFSLFSCIFELKNYTESVGVQHVLVQKLHSFPYEELEFFIPQFVQLLVVYETDSMALEEFLLQYSEKFPHFSLIVFWNLQAYIFELRNEPESRSFQTVRSLISKIQNIMFNTDSSFKRKIEFRENLQPGLVLCGAIASSFAIPSLSSYCLPIIQTQGRQQKSLVFKLANFQKSLTKNLTMKNQRMSAEVQKGSHSDNESPSSSLFKNSLHRSASVPRSGAKKVSMSVLSDESEAYTTDDDDHKTSIELEKSLNSLDLVDPHKNKSDKYSETEDNLRISTIIKSKKRVSSSSSKAPERSWTEILSTDDYSVNSKSLPDLTKVKGDEITPYLSPAESETSLVFHHTTIGNDLLRSNSVSSIAPKSDRLVKALQVNYARNVTQFMMAMQNISIRLSQVPKEARLSALRAELSIINETMLPSEIDIPQLLPITSKRNKKYHKILKLNINEACVLNSAERVPFLLLIEYLSDEIDFNPFTEYNQKIITSMKLRKATDTKQRDNSEFNEPIEPSKMNGTDSRTSVDKLPVENLRSSDIEEADLSEMSMTKRSLNISRNLTLTTTHSDISKEQKGIPNIPTLNTREVSTKVLADQMRIASVMLQQLDSSGQANSEQSLSIKSKIVQSMISLQNQFDSIDYEKLNQLQGDKPSAGERKLENDFKLAEDWNTKKQRIRKASAYGHLANWELCSVIAKNGDDLPQEAFACQLISMISNIWKRNEVPVWTKRMKILITSANTGLVETIINAMSIHSIKKSLTELSIKKGENAKGRIFTLLDYYKNVFGPENSAKFKVAQENFTNSLAAYSVICYVLQIKDRHNGNIMVDGDGHIIHIDFGFLLSNSPGSVGFEAAPFKLTSEYVDLLGGLDSPMYARFVDLCKQCFKILRNNSQEIVDIVELMQRESSLPCFNNGENTSVLLKQRLQLDLSESDTDLFVENVLIGKSLGSMYTRLYDQFQMITQGIYS